MRRKKPEKTTSKFSSSQQKFDTSIHFLSCCVRCSSICHAPVNLSNEMQPYPSSNRQDKTPIWSRPFRHLNLNLLLALVPASLNGCKWSSNLSTKKRREVCWQEKRKLTSTKGRRRAIQQWTMTKEVWHNKGHDDDGDCGNIWSGRASDDDEHKRGRSDESEKKKKRAIVDTRHIIDLTFCVCRRKERWEREGISRLYSRVISRSNWVEKKGTKRGWNWIFCTFIIPR